MVSEIIGKKFNRISRAVDMLCLFLGEDYSFVNVHGKQIDAAEYTVHFQTQWRFREEGDILLASRDIYEPYCEDVPEDWRFDLTGRPDGLSSVFDVRAKAFTEKMQGTVVTGCSLSAVNDMVILFSNGVVFEQFMPASRKNEEWRLTDCKGGKHIVCCDEGGSVSQE